MHSHFDANFFAGNRKRLRAAVGNDAPIILTGNGQMQRAADEPFRFVQDSNFWYLTGLNAPELTLVMTRGGTFLIVPVLSTERIAFDGDYNLDELRTRSGINDVLDERAGWARVRAALADARHSANTLGSVPAYLTRYRMHSLPYRRRLITKLKRLDTAVKLTDIRPQLAVMRSVKQPAELAALQQAIDITAETLGDITRRDALGTAKHEYELEAAVTYGFRRRGAEGHAFEPIVGAGRDGTTLHHVLNNGPVQQNDLVVLDVGASVEHYAADVTRTVCAGTPTDRQRAVYDAVLAVQDYALGLLKPGVLLHDYEQAVGERMGQALQKLGLIGTGDAAKGRPAGTHDTGGKLDPGAIRRYYPHATSHFLGLDTHDVGDYSRPLEPGMVLTCEPGIYIPQENIGVRLEDDVLITETGNRVLSAACPRQITSIQ